MIAHTLGNPFEINKVREFCNKNKLWLIEDNCDALGSRYLLTANGNIQAPWGTSVLQLLSSHHITMGEGGAVYTNDWQLKRIVESLRDWGRDCWCPSGHDNTCGHRFQKQLVNFRQDMTTNMCIPILDIISRQQTCRRQ